jgi:hypothetical protein
MLDMDDATKTWWVESIFGEVAEAGNVATITDDAAFTLALRSIAFAMHRTGQAKAADTLRSLVLAPDPAAYQRQHPASVRQALRLLRKSVYSDRLRPLVELVEIPGKEEDDVQAVQG